MKLISFYCDVDNNKYYSNHASRLTQKCKHLNIDFLIVEHKIGNNWIENVRAKPNFLLKMMNELNEDFIWLDIDCDIHKKIDFDLTADWMGDLRSDGTPHDYVHFIKNTTSNKEFMLRWINKIKSTNRGSHTSFVAIYKDLNFCKIPDGYFSIVLSKVNSKQLYFKGNTTK